NVISGSTITLPSVPVREGYTFEGWYTDTELTKIFDEDSIITSNMNIYGKWNKEIEYYTVDFYKTGEDTEIYHSANVISGSTITLPSVPVREGYTFEGWYTDTELTKIFDEDSIITSSMNLYGKWKEENTHPDKPSRPSRPTRPTKPAEPTVSVNKPVVKTNSDIETTLISQNISQTADITKDTAILKVKGNTVNEVVASIKELEENNSQDKYESVIEFTSELPKDSKGKNIKESNVEFNKININKIVEETKADVLLSTEVADIKFSNDALKNIINQAEGLKLNVTAQAVDKKELTDKVQKAVNEYPIYKFEVASNNENISNVDNSEVTISIPYELTKDKNPQNIVINHISEDGKFELVKDCYYNEESGKITFKTSDFSTYVIGYNDVEFNDISTKWSKDYINFVAARNLFSGTGNKVFNSEMTMTRGMFVTVLGRLEGIDTSRYSETRFSDVDINDYYGTYVQWAKEKGIVNGVGNNKFAPNENVTREQMAAILVNYVEKTNKDLNDVTKNNKFTDDEEISNYAKNAVKQMKKWGIIKGKNNNEFDPQGNATRGEVAKVITEFIINSIK
ncbi:S-layer homology domain-containing protein, partial [Vallitalea longa]|uniref:S-layer homology domain-containing protein n=1 Tax=Vallitalea longa TaxID=2936439 RepID=UPI002490AB41